MDKKIVLLGGKGDSTNIVFHALNETYGIHTAIIEESESKQLFLKRRLKKLGFFQVSGQVLFQVLVVKWLDFFSKKRISEIISENALNVNEIPESKIKSVSSVNSAECIELLKTIQPDLIIVNGTRIISKKVLESVSCKFINTHAGITPMYRGVHGTYWALAENDKENSGVTVHFVDAGIDTGNIIYQSVVIPTSKDNFVTYPLLQLAEGLRILKLAVKASLDGQVETQSREGNSKLRYHPAIWQYFYYRIFRKVK